MSTKQDHAIKQMTPEEKRQAQLIAGFTYFENGKARFPEAYNELLYSMAVTAYNNPPAFASFILNATDDPEVQPQKYLDLADALESLVIELRLKWRDKVGGAA